MIEEESVRSKRAGSKKKEVSERITRPYGLVRKTQALVNYPRGHRMDTRDEYSLEVIL